MNEYKVIGLMSGTSLDGVDIAACTFNRSGNQWLFNIECAETIEYKKDWKEKLANIENKSALDLLELDASYGKYLGELVTAFIQRYSLTPDLISSHGHTIFHQPEKHITLQIGSGAAIAAQTNMKVVCDFRTLDVARSGQGAPLVPIGDELLFKNYDYCLNLGGIANISYHNGSKRFAFDICPVNMALNYLTAKVGKEYDTDGLMAKEGSVSPDLLAKLSTLEFYSKKPPKSLGKEWVFEHFIPVIDQSTISISDKLATICEHIAIEIATATIDGSFENKMLVTGGGTFNKFLTERIKDQSKVDIVIPDKNTINYKEALIFAFLGILRVRNEVNSLKSVTGAERDSIGGAIYQG